MFMCVFTLFDAVGPTANFWVGKKQKNDFSSDAISIIIYIIYCPVNAYGPNSLGKVSVVLMSIDGIKVNRRFRQQNVKHRKKN